MVLGLLGRYSYFFDTVDLLANGAIQIRLNCRHVVGIYASITFSIITFVGSFRGYNATHANVHHSMIACLRTCQ